MEKTIRILSLIAALAMIMGIISFAEAEAVSLSIVLVGVPIEGTDGGAGQVPIEGTCRVFQNGREVGTVQAGGSPILLSSTQGIRLEPIPESIGPGWDLGSGDWVLRNLRGGSQTVTIALREGSTNAETGNTTGNGNGTGDGTGTTGDTAADSTGAGTDDSTGAIGAEITVDTAADSTGAGTDDSTGAGDEGPVQAAAPISTPTLPAAPAATPAPTEAPPMAPLPATATGGTVRVNVFQDKNGNGEQGNYEDGIPKVTLAVETEDGTAVARMETGADGIALFENIPEGTYRLHAWAPEKRCFSKKGKTNLLTSNCMTTTAEPDCLSEPFRVRALSTTELGVGLMSAVRISGYCWLETLADGISRDDEQRLPGVRVTLDGVKNGLHYETVSGEDGSYSFDRVRPGGYTLTAYTPEGMMFTRYSAKGGDSRSIITREGATKGSKALDTSDGEDAPRQNIGFVWAGAITGRCFLDANYNGFYDEGELPMKGVKIAVAKPNAEKELATVRSGEDGLYTVPSLRGGTYRIRVVLPDDGSDFSRTVTDPLGNHFAARSGRRENFWNDFLLADMEKREVNIGVIYPAKVTGTVYMDNDFSGSRTGKEKIVGGFMVTLTDAAGNVVGSDKTNVKGLYEIPGVVPGEYTLQATALNGYAFTRVGEGNVMLNRGAGGGESAPFRVELGEDRTGMDMGMILPGTVQGTVFADLNDNGIREAEEAGLAGVVVRLMSEEGEAFRAEIGEDGGFLFDAVMPGRYYLEYILPPEAIFARVPNAVQGGNTITESEIISNIPGASDAIESPVADAVSNPASDAVSNPAAPRRVGRGDWFDFKTGDQVTAPLCGGLTLGRITAVIFRDPEGAGALPAWAATSTAAAASTAAAGTPAALPPLPGLILTLTPSRADLAPLQVMSGAEGRVEIRGIHPDEWTLEVVCPEGTVLSRTDGMELPLKPGLARQQVSLLVAMGQRWENQPLGCAAPASLEGRLWLDENNNGRMEPGEGTPAGYQVSVTDEETGALYATLVTDGEGRFAAEGLIPGSYTVSFDLDENLTAPKAGDSTFLLDENLTAPKTGDSPVLPEGNRLVMTGIRLQEGEVRNDLRLGVVRYTSISGTVWMDLGGTIAPLAGAGVTLKDEAGNALAAMTTAAEGTYGFSRLLPGIYRIEADLPEGCVAVEPDDARLAGTLVSILRETDRRHGVSDDIVVAMGRDLTGMDIGAVQPGAVGDFCWLDVNGDGLQGMGEGGIPHVRIELVRDGITVVETESDQYGFYRFTDVYPAIYSLKVTPPAEVGPTRQGAQPRIISSCLAETPAATESTATIATTAAVFTSEEIRVESAEANYNADLGFVLRTPGIYPPGYGEGATQNWTGGAGKE